MKTRLLPYMLAAGLAVFGGCRAEPGYQPKPAQEKPARKAGMQLYDISLLADAVKECTKARKEAVVKLVERLGKAKPKETANPYFEASSIVAGEAECYWRERETLPYDPVLRDELWDRAVERKRMSGYLFDLGIAYNKSRSRQIDDNIRKMISDMLEKAEPLSAGR